jgi:hypothetical protein
MSSSSLGQQKNYLTANLPPTVPTNERMTSLVNQWLKQGVNKSLVNSISVANPAVVTTAAAHGFLTGQTVTFAGTTTTPDVSGAQVATVTGATTFTIPVNVTSGQAGAAGSVSAVAGNMPNATLLWSQLLKQAQGS